MKIKYTYSIHKNKESGEYVVFKENEEHFISLGVFHSKDKKLCLEYIKNINKKRKTK